MSKSLYLIALISLVCWTIGLFAFPAAGLVYLFLVSGLIALLFAVVSTVVEIWCTTIKDMLD
ncbi:MAG TPA: DUF5670 family protein [Mucilaginibacter sp.]|nr:DUF5670 family protein [Mucilaginibacter sp.]